jgi:hypothetical protein
MTRAALAGLALACWACGASSAAPPAVAQPPDAGDDAPAVVPSEAASDDATSLPDAAPPADAGASDSLEASSADADAAPVDHFVTGVVSFDPGACGGFGAAAMPGVVEGPPVGGGSSHGGTDVVSLGSGGSIVLSFAPEAIVDGPGPDFIVFENPFWVSGNMNDVFAEPGEVSVSDDGVTWQTFPCDPPADASGTGGTSGTGVAPPYGQCAGWHVVWSSPTNGISPVDPAVAGGDAFDLADLGVARARYVRIVDKTREACPDSGAHPESDGFDLDAVSIVHASP